MTRRIALDLGTATTAVTTGLGEGRTYPTVLATNGSGSRAVAFGAVALELGGRGAGGVRIVRPIRRSEIEDLGMARLAVDLLFSQLGVSRWSRAEVCAVVPAATTGVQSRALAGLLEGAGARRVQLLESPLAAAIGARLPIADSAGCMVVDCGAGSTGIGVYALGGTVVSRRIKLGGSDLDGAIRAYCLAKANVLLDLGQAEEIKWRLGSAAALGSAASEIEVLGRDSGSGAVRSIVLHPEDLAEAVEPVVGGIVAGVVAALGAIPPELGTDLIGQGIHLVGGGAAVAGLDLRLARATSMTIHLVERHELCALDGVLSFVGGDHARPPRRKRSGEATAPGHRATASRGAPGSGSSRLKE